ncbi:MAG: hypothetical protein ACPGWS_00195 [Solirubrobacterales bacterium]
MGMTERDKKLLAIFAAVVLLGGYWFLILGGKRQAVADAEQAVQEAQSALDTAKSSAQQGQIEKKRYPVSYARVLRMGKAIPTDSDFPSLLVQVNDVSEDANVNFLSLTSSEGSTDSGAEVGATGGTTTCEADGTVTETTGSTGSSGSSGATSTGATGSTAQSGVGKARDNATDAQQSSNADGERAASESADFAVKCASSPTLTDVAAQASGLRVYSYTFTFEGSFFDLYKVYNGLLDMVRVKNGRISVTGRLLQINSITTAVKSFPQLTATVSMTGYALPTGSTITAGATSTGPAGTESVSSSAPAQPAPAAGGGAPPAAFVGVK